MRQILFCGRGWATTHIWLPRLREHGAGKFAFFDPALSGYVPGKAGNDSEVILASLDEATTENTRIGVVASPNYLHQYHALALLQRGIPVVVEKPVCLSTAGRIALETTATENNTLLLRSCGSLYDPHVSYFSALLREFDLSYFTRVRARWLRADGIPGSRWLTRAEYAMAGSSLDLGWHLLECIMAILDYPRTAVRAATFSGQITGEADTKRFASWYSEDISLSRGLIDVDVAASISMVTETGTDVILATAWHTAVPNDEVVMEVTGKDFALKLVTLLGMSPVGPAYPRIEGVIRGKAIRRALSPKVSGAAYDEMMRQFVAANFNPAALGQTWAQLDVIAAVAEKIVERHTEWRNTAIA